MGYKTRRRVVQKVLPYLERLNSLKQQRKSLLFNHPTPKRLAYDLRQALAVASRFEEYREYAKLGRNFRFKVHPRGVEANYYEDAYYGSEPVHYEVGEIFPNVSDLVGVVGAVIDSEERNPVSLIYPNVVLGELEMVKVWTWAHTKGFVTILLDNGGLKLARQLQPGEEAWEPPQRS